MVEGVAPGEVNHREVLRWRKPFQAKGGLFMARNRKTSEINRIKGLLNAEGRAITEDNIEMMRMELEFEKNRDLTPWNYIYRLAKGRDDIVYR